MGTMGVWRAGWCFRNTKTAVRRMYWEETYTFLPNFRNCLRLLTRIGKTHKPARIKSWVGLPGGAVVKNPPANAGDMGSIPDPGRSHMPWSN